MAATLFVALCAVMLAPAAGRTNGLRGEAPLGRVDAGEVRASLQEALSSVLSGISKNHTERLSEIQRKLMPTYQALPKASEDRLGPRSVRYLLKSFFSKEHGWTLLGFDSVEETSEVEQSAGILQAKVPALMESIMEAREHGRGLTLSEVAALATALEHLIFDESVKLLARALELNGYSASDSLAAFELNEVLVSYLALFATVNKSAASSLTVLQHVNWKKQMMSKGKFLLEKSFAWDTIQNHDFARFGKVSPFAAPSYPFETSARVVDLMAADYGRWQDESCKLMRDAFDAHDPYGTGRVSLIDFYSIQTPGFALSESRNQLRELGMLDESAPGRPAVRTANYILSSANCGEYSNYYHVCCMSGCGSIMNQLEAEFQAPTVAPESLLRFLYNISSTADEDFHIATSPLLGISGATLSTRLDQIARRHGGKVPLHGRLFETWLHFAFPSECPLPLKAPAAKDLSVEAMRRVAPDGWVLDIDTHLPTDEAQWADADELLPLLEDVSSPSPTSSIRSFMRIVAMAGACVAWFCISLQDFQSKASSIWRSQKRFSKVKQDDDCALPLRF